MIVRFGSAMAFAMLLILIGAGNTSAAFAATSAVSATTVAGVDDKQPPADATANAAATDSTTDSSTANSAAVNPRIANPVAAANPVVGSSPSNLASGLIFLLAMLLVAAWLIKRSGGMPSLRGGSAIKVVAALSVGPRERVLLVEVGGQQWLLGVTPGSINNLHHFAEPVVAAGNSEEFSNKLRQLLPQGFGK